MKKLVLSVSIGNRPFTKYTLKTIEEYAYKIKADYKLISEYKVPEEYNDIPIGRNGNTVYLVKLLVVQDYLKIYDRIIFLDDSCIVNTDYPNLFDIVPYNFLGANNEGVLEWPTAATKTIDLFNRSNLPKNILTKHDYINTGILVISKHHSELFSKNNILSLGKKKFFANAWPEQTYMNYVLSAFTIPVFYLPHHFNRMSVHKERLEERVNYSNYTIDHLREQVHTYKDFDFLTKEMILPGKTNHAFIWHLTSFWKDSPRTKLAKRLFEITRFGN
jgi:lipopolysaccharide biosynthesis glycosyltransferase